MKTKKLRHYEKEHLNFNIECVEGVFTVTIEGRLPELGYTGNQVEDEANYIINQALILMNTLTVITEEDTLNG